jgi:hypothetical protein
MEADRRFSKNGKSKQKKKEKDVQSLALKMAMTDIRTKFGMNENE